MQFAGKRPLFGFPGVNQAAGECQAKPIAALQNKKAAFAPDDGGGAAQGAKDGETGIARNTASRDDREKSLLPAPPHAGRLSGCAGISPWRRLLRRAVSGGIPDGGCRTVYLGGFSLRVGTLAASPASYLLLERNNRELRESMAVLYPNMSTVGGQPLLEAASLVGGVSFWVTVVLAAAGSVLSIICIADPVSHPKDRPYAFIGQWFIWLATALLWGTVAASLACSWLKPADLIAVLIVGGIARWASRAACHIEWDTRRSRIPGFFPGTDPSPTRQ